MEIATQKDAYKLIHQGILALSDAEAQGIRIDLDYCKKKEKQLTEELKELEESFYSTKFYRHWRHSRGGRNPNINSDDQLRNFLYKVKGIEPVKTTDTGKGSTDEDSLLALDIPELKDLLEMSKIRKIRDTYLRGFIKEQVNGFIHPHFNLHTARTFRSSSNAPNFQNIPKRDKTAQKIVRQALYPRKGYQLLEVDYSGIEVCISACYHHDPTMIDYIKDPSSDMHGDMAAQIFMIDDFDRTYDSHDRLRGGAKNGFVFPQFYGDYYGNCAPTLACEWGRMPEKSRWKPTHGIDLEGGTTLGNHLINNGFRSLKSFTNHIQNIEEDFWGRRFAEYGRWKKRQWREYQKKGYIDMLTGFRCQGPMNKKNVTNYPIQGAAFHCLLWSFIEVNRQLKKRKMKTRLIGQVHDSMVLDVHPNELKKVITILRMVMVDKLTEHWPWIIVPLEVDMDIGEVDGSWYGLKSEKEYFKLAS